MQIYYSRSNEVDDEEISPYFRLISNIIEEHTGEYPIIKMHERGSTYNPELVTTSDCVIVGVYDMDDDEPKIAKGCYTEIMAAHERDIPVFFIRIKDWSVYLERIRKDDQSILDPDCWQIGYAKILSWGKIPDHRIGQLIGKIDNKHEILDMFVYADIDWDPDERGKPSVTYFGIDGIEGKIPENTADDTDDELLLLG